MGYKMIKTQQPHSRGPLCGMKDKRGRWWKWCGRACGRQAAACYGSRAGRRLGRKDTLRLHLKTVLEATVDKMGSAYVKHVKTSAHWVKQSRKMSLSQGSRPASQETQGQGANEFWIVPSLRVFLGQMSVLFSWLVTWWTSSLFGAGSWVRGTRSLEMVWMDLAVGDWLASSADLWE